MINHNILVKKKKSYLIAYNHVIRDGATTAGTKRHRKTCNDLYTDYNIIFNHHTVYSIIILHGYQL